MGTHRNSIFLERAIVSERIRLAMGLPLRPMDEQAPTNAGIENSVIASKYYDPPLINIIKFACSACPPKKVEVTDMCRAAFAPSLQGGLPQWTPSASPPAAAR